MTVRLQPLSIFRIPFGTVVQCRIVEGNPYAAQGKDFVYRDGALTLSLNLRGTNRRQSPDGTYDLLFDGPLDPSMTPSAEAVIVEDQQTDPMSGQAPKGGVRW
jgi:hypothetical protein